MWSVIPASDTTAVQSAISDLSDRSTVAGHLVKAIGTTLYRHSISPTSYYLYLSVSDFVKFLGVTPDVLKGFMKKVRLYFFDVPIPSRTKAKTPADKQRKRKRELDQADDSFGDDDQHWLNFTATISWDNTGTDDNPAVKEDMTVFRTWCGRVSVVNLFLVECYVCHHATKMMTTLIYKCSDAGDLSIESLAVASKWKDNVMAVYHILRVYYGEEASDDIYEQFEKWVHAAVSLSDGDSGEPTKKKKKGKMVNWFYEFNKCIDGDHHGLMSVTDRIGMLDDGITQLTGIIERAQAALDTLVVPTTTTSSLPSLPTVRRRCQTLSSQ